ncbi:MAG: putative transport system permease protein [Actinomycetota bacterium]|nr:putative transport system permease protein [Actinomycetota bacterium]
MLRATFKSLLARKLRLLLSAMSIVLGVSFVSGAFVLTDSLGKVFDDLFSTVNKNIAVDVRGTKVSDVGSQTSNVTRKLVPVSVLDQVRSVDGVAEARGSIAGLAQIIDTHGKAVASNAAPNFGFMWVTSDKLEAAKISSGRAPTGPNEIVINTGLATKAGYQVGDKAPVLTEGPTRSFTIVGLVTYEGKPSLAGETSIFFTEPTAHELLNRTGTYDEIEVASSPGVSQSALRDRIAKVLPRGTEAITGKAYTDESTSDIKKGLGFFATFLLVFAAVALFVGAFIIFNTFTMLVAQRTRELALMRALGASRNQVTRSVLVEAVVIGALSSVIGLLVGIGVAALLKAVFGAVGAELPSGPTVIATRTVIVSFAVGILVTALAAFMPARRASKVAPVAALRDAATPDRSLKRQTVIASIVFVLGAIAMARALTAGGLKLLGLGTVLAFIGIALLSPLIGRPVSRALGTPFRRALPGRLGRENAMRNPRRTASTAAALMIGIALVTAVSILGASLKATVVKVVAGAVSADFLLTTQRAGFPDAVVTKVRSAPGVADASGLKFDGVVINKKTEFVTALDPEVLGKSVTLEQVSGSVDGLSPTSILMSDKQAKTDKVHAGSKVSMKFGTGVTRTFTLAGTYKENQLIGGFLLDKTAAKDFATQRNGVALIKLKKGADPAVTRAALEADIKAYPTIQVQDQSEFVAATGKQIDSIVNIISVLLILSIIIAILGVVNTLALSVIERTRELGLLRAVGMARRQMKRMVRVEAVIIAVFGGLLGIAVGSAFGIALQQALKSQGVSELGIPVTRLVEFLVVAGLTGVLAAWLPARRASRLNILNAIATE